MPAASTSAGAALRIVQEARSLIGIPYALGGKSRNGADCSGFVWLVHANAGCHYAYRNTSHFVGIPEFAEVAVPEDGDVVLFRGHMGIYDGGKVISAQSGLGKVHKGDLAWFGAIVGYYRWR